MFYIYTKPFLCFVSGGPTPKAPLPQGPIALLHALWMWVDEGTPCRAVWVGQHLILFISILPLDGTYLDILDSNTGNN